MIRLGVRVRRAEAELALAELLELSPGGLEERDLGDHVEYALYGAPGELPELGDLQAAIGGALVDVSSREIDDDWSERWRAFHAPLVLGSELVVRPPWTRDVVIDPGQAFGTGGHATTRLCLELLLGLAPRAGRLLDLGCGSGVLAITAAKLGWAPVLAVDSDPLAVAATQANAAANEVELEVVCLDLRRDAIPVAPIVLANLLRPLLLTLAERVHDVPEVLIASGLLAEDADEVVAACAARGLVEHARRTGQGWAALGLAREDIPDPYRSHPVHGGARKPSAPMTTI